MKKVILGITAAALLAVPATASAGNGKTFKECFNNSYGQTGLQYGQLKKDPPAGHPAGGYGIGSVLAAHGPEGLLPLCSS